MYHLILAIFVVYREWVNLAIVSDWLLFLWRFLLCRQRYIVISLLTNILIVSRIGQKRLLNSNCGCKSCLRIFQLLNKKKRSPQPNIIYMEKNVWEYSDNHIKTCRHMYVVRTHANLFLFLPCTLKDPKVLQCRGTRCCIYFVMTNRCSPR